MAVNGVERYALVNAFRNDDDDTISKVLTSIVQNAVAASMHSFFQKLQDFLWSYLLEKLKWCAVGILMIGAAIVLRIQTFRGRETHTYSSAPSLYRKEGSQTRASTSATF